MSRRKDIEAARVAATFLVVWYHCPSELPDLTYAGLVFFVIASTYFSVREAAAGEYVSGRRVGRLLFIWVFWYAVYALISLAEGKINGYINGPMSRLLLVGPAIHLWYLPFLAAILLVARKAAQAAEHPFGLGVVGVLYATSMILVSSWRPWTLELGVPWAQYAHVLPGVFLGILFAAMGKHPERDRIWFLVFALGFTLPAWFAPGVGVTYFVGLFLASTILIARERSRAMNWLSRPAKYMLGIYLIHPLLIRLIRHEFGPSGLALAAIAFFLSLFIVMAIHFAAPRLARSVF